MVELILGYALQYNSHSGLKTAASNWYLHGFVIEKSNVFFWMISWLAENAIYCYPCKWQMEENRPIW